MSTTTHGQGVDQLWARPGKSCEVGRPVCGPRCRRSWRSAHPVDEVDEVGTAAPRPTSGSALLSTVHTPYYHSWFQNIREGVQRGVPL